MKSWRRIDESTASFPIFSINCERVSPGKKVLILLETSQVFVNPQKHFLRGITRISFVSVIVPVVALVLGGIFRHERLAPSSILGSALVIAGVLLRIHADRLKAVPAAARPS